MGTARSTCAEGRRSRWCQHKVTSGLGGCLGVVTEGGGGAERRQGEGDTAEGIRAEAAWWGVVWVRGLGWWRARGSWRRRR